MSISAAVSTLRPTIEQLAGFAALEPDWDSYGGLPSSPRAISAATELLVLVADRFTKRVPSMIVPYAVAPSAGGGVQVEWRGPGQEIEVEVGPDGRLSYLQVEGEGDQRRYGEHGDVPLQQALAAIAAVLGD